MTEYGVHPRMSEADYHAMTSALSSGGARRLAATCPAQFRYEQDHPRQERPDWDFGRAAHRVVLGVGAGVCIPRDPDGKAYAEWRTADAKAQVDAARARGETPMKPREWGIVAAMADALRADPVAGPIYNSDEPRELTLIWEDDETGILRRARFDSAFTTTGGRLVIVDYKTADTADPQAFRKHVANYGYHQQDAYYRDAAATCELDDMPGFVFVVQAKTPPHLVSVVQLDDEAIEEGWRRNRAAIRTYAECLESGVWPGWTSGIETIGLPRWAVTGG